jgi:hypothetical protein
MSRIIVFELDFFVLSLDDFKNEERVVFIAIMLSCIFNQSNLSLKTLRDFSIDMVVLYLNFNQSSCL